MDKEDWADDEYHEKAEELVEHYMYWGIPEDAAKEHIKEKMYGSTAIGLHYSLHEDEQYKKKGREYFGWRAIKNPMALGWWWTFKTIFIQPSIVKLYLRTIWNRMKLKLR